ncbi:uncharacterized protein LOC142585145 isoform X2 [Dermacentor variabilis]|uniref:uncharacterized protein LOC142585145 isoform X2 n=1 Tax=Dermacentor variabilis TaxID=34621 RepID=UPI003F5BFE5B
MDAKSVAFVLLCTAFAVNAQSYGGGIRRVPGDFSEGRPGGLLPGGGFGGEVAGGFPGGYPERGPERFPEAVSGSYPGRRPGRFPGRDVYPGGFPGGTNPTLCGDRICPIGTRCVVHQAGCVRQPCKPIRTCVS